ncbi:MAG: hypothetical protein GTO18_11215 [Anaerolineales bacterium]|nr:hypothetical protein [Anaerolineales bacterium]
MREEIRISGFGGQGVVLAGLILGKALSLYQNLEAVMTQSYGPEARGGASSANLVVADRPIDYPFIQNTGILVALSQEAYTKYRPRSGPDARVFIDDGLVTPENNDKVHGIPATKLAEELGRRIVANMIMLGFLTASVDLIQREAVEEAIKTSVKSRLVQLNLEAFNVGARYVTEMENVLE